LLLALELVDSSIGWAGLTANWLASRVLFSNISGKPWAHQTLKGAESLTKGRDKGTAALICKRKAAELSVLCPQLARTW
jgi:hypothetical protein